MTYWVVQTLNGLSFGMLLFMLAAGLSLMFGLMRIINLAHGSYYLLGGFIALSLVRLTENFYLALLLGPLLVAILAVAMERLFLSRFPNDELAQVLLTFGFLLFIADSALWLWGPDPQTIPRPDHLRGAVAMGEVIFPLYRLVVIGSGIVTALLIAYLITRTRLGAIIRAAVDDPEMVRALGINLPVIWTLLFALGGFLAALGGVLGGGYIGIYHGSDLEVLLLALAVVIIGGLGSLRGAFVGSILVGLLDTFGKALFPELSLFTIFAPMALIIAIRPAGLFGRP